MLTKCPECQLPVSDKAIICPHCGYPLDAKAIRRTSSKRKRLPNGFGQISEIKNKNLRNPFRAMVTVGFNENGKPINKLLKPVSYFRTYNEAYAALVEYNKNPYELQSEMTVKELYAKWSDKYFQTLKSPSSVRTITSAWAYCSSVYNLRSRDLRARHIKHCMDEGTANINGVIHTPTAGVKARIKSMFNLMLDYALEYELVDKNYARTFELSDGTIKEIEENRQEHLSFTDEEMKTLWENINAPWVKVILFQCYSGWRPQELGLLETANVNLDRNIIIGGMKTEAGINRAVPIHSAVRWIAEEYKSDNKYLFTCEDGSRLTYEKYRNRFNKTISILGLNPNHRPHDPRKQFVTMCKKYNVDEYAIKYIVGHKISDITESIYTERDSEWLGEEIEKIKGPV